MFVQSVEFIRAHAGGNGNGGKAKGDISIYGQESNYTTWRLAKMNLAIRGIDGQIGHGDTFHNDRHPDLKADFILANPPFNISDWGGERPREDKRWQYGVPPAGNANFAWVQHIAHHLAPAGVAGFVLSNGSMSSNQSGEGEIRKSLIEADLVDCMVALPGQLFYSTQIPACLQPHPLHRRPQARPHGGPHAQGSHRRGHRPHRQHLHAWRGERISPSPASAEEGRGRDGGFEPHAASPSSGSSMQAGTRTASEGAFDYADVAGFCKSAPLEEVRKHGHVLTPGRYVGAEAAEDDGEPFEEKMKRLTTTLREQQAEAAQLDRAIRENLAQLGYRVEKEDAP